MAARTRQLETVYPNCSANKPGAQPDSAAPLTSTNFNNRSSRLINKSLSYGCNSKNPTKTSPPPANSCPTQRLPADRLTGKFLHHTHTPMTLEIN